MDPIRIVLVEPEKIFMRGLVSTLQGNAERITIVGAAASGAEGLKVLRAQMPDVAILAIRLPDMSGVTVLEQIRVLPTKVLVLTGEDDTRTIYKAVANGAQGYLLKFGSPIDLPDAIQRIMAGEIVLGAWAVQALVAGIRRLTQQELLTTRELEVLTLIRDGRTQPQIARELNITLATVKSHCYRMYHKLGARNAIEAIGTATAKGLF